MKTLILFSIIISVGLVSFAEEKSIADFEFAMELGYIPLYGFTLHETEYTDGQNLFISFTGKIIILDTVFAGGSIRNDFSFAGDFKFWPSADWYGIFAGVQIGGFQIGVRHSCFHPVMAYANTHGNGETNIEGGYTEIYIKFEGKIKLF